MNKFSRIRRGLALQAKRVQFRARQSHFLYTLFHSTGAFRSITVSFLLISFISFIFISVYVSLFYSTRYRSEFHFSVQNAGLFNSAGGQSVPGSAPDIALIQNTQIAYEFIKSFDLFLAFENNPLFLRSFSNKNIDIFSRYDTNWNDEKRFNYWKSLIDRNIQLPAGTIKVSFDAFDPQIANELSLFIVNKISIQLNSVNSNIFNMLVLTNRQHLEMSQNLYLQSVGNLALGRQTAGLIDPIKWADDVAKIISEIRATLLLSKSELAALKSHLLGRSPQAEIVERRLKELSQELTELNDTLVKTNSANSISIVEAIKNISLLDLQKSVAQKLVEISTENFELSKQLSTITQSYVQVFVQPNIVSITTPYDRLFWIIFSAIALIFLTLTFLYIMNFIRARL